MSNTVKLSDAQYKLMELIRQNGSVPCFDKDRKTFKKLMEYGLVDYDRSYSKIIFTHAGKKFEL